MPHTYPYPLQDDSDTPLHLAASENNATRVKHLLSTPGIDVNIRNKVSYSQSNVNLYRPLVLN